MERRLSRPDGNEAGGGRRITASRHPEHAVTRDDKHQGRRHLGEQKDLKAKRQCVDKMAKRSRTKVGRDRTARHDRKHGGGPLARTRTALEQFHQTKDAHTRKDGSQDKPTGNNLTREIAAQDKETARDMETVVNEQQGQIEELEQQFSVHTRKTEVYQAPKAQHTRQQKTWQCGKWSTCCEFCHLLCRFFSLIMRVRCRRDSGDCRMFPLCHGTLRFLMSVSFLG